MRAAERPDVGLEALASALGSQVVDAAPVPWGDSGSTHRVDLADGRRLAARVIEAGRRDDAIRAARAMTVAGRAAIPVPTPTVLDAVGSSWFVTPWVEGDVGARWLDTPERAQVLARAMGTLQRAVRAIDPRLAPLAFVHGDFAPINVVLAADGTVAGLLDFDHAHAGDPLTDVAWWGWVVRHHHPDAWSAAWPTFCSAAGADLDRDGPALRTLMLGELSRRAAATVGDPDRRRWLDRLAEASAW